MNALDELREMADLQECGRAFIEIGQLREIADRIESELIPAAARDDAPEVGAVRGFKAFDTGLSCLGYQYQIGKSYHHDGKVSLCESGFHFCRKLVDCFGYYPFDCKTRICEVEASGEVVDGDDGKSVASDIRVIRELAWDEVLAHVNTGDRNTGYCNSGNCNSGNWNTGYGNSGNCNSGNCNSGNWNTGYGNSGNCNSGNCNSGDWNMCDGSSGVLCSEEHNILIFDEPSDWTLKDWRDSDAASLMSGIESKTTEWVPESVMSDGEKASHSSYETTGGYLRVYYNPHPAYAEWWSRLSDSERETIKAIPNFTAKKWAKITGIEVPE